MTDPDYHFKTWSDDCLLQTSPLTYPLTYAEIQKYIMQVRRFRIDPTWIKLMIPSQEQYDYAIECGVDPNYLIKGWEHD